MYRLAVYFILVLIVSCGHPAYKNTHVIIETEVGDIELELFTDKAPITTAAFLNYIDTGLYTNSSFYRVLKTDEFPSEVNTGIIQGGIWQTNPAKKLSIAGIAHETTKLTGLTHQSGTISLARLTPGTASTEFFICIGDQSPFDFGRRGTDDGKGFAAFGRVYKGMAIVRKIQAKKNVGDKFEEKITIKKITRL
jgi:peptidyl-prolyl cis-trans isomerase A (cyclophilin A)